MIWNPIYPTMKWKGIRIPQLNTTDNVYSEVVMDILSERGKWAQFAFVPIAQMCRIQEGLIQRYECKENLCMTPDVSIPTTPGCFLKGAALLVTDKNIS